MIITNYRVKDIDDPEDFLNKLFIGLKYYQKKNPNMCFKLTYTKETIQLKTLKLNESSN